jgi:hypothetical protein
MQWGLSRDGERKQASAELCQAQVKHVLVKPTLSSAIELVFPVLNIEFFFLAQK